MATPLDMQQNPLHSGAAVDSKSSPTSDNRSSGRSSARSSSRNLESSDKCYVPGSPLPMFPSSGESVPTAQSGSQRMAALTRRAVQSVWRDPQRNADERKRTSSRMANFPTMSGVYGRGSNHLGAGDKDIVAHMPSDRFSENQDTGGISANERGEEDGLELMATNEEDQRKHEIEQAGFTLLKGFKLHFAMPETEMDYRDEMDCRRNPRYIVRAWALGTALYITSLTRLESYFQDNDPAAQMVAWSVVGGFVTCQVAPIFSYFRLFYNETIVIVWACLTIMANLASSAYRSSMLFWRDPDHLTTEGHEETLDCDSTVLTLTALLITGVHFFFDVRTSQSWMVQFFAVVAYGLYSLIPITIEKKNGEDHTESLGPEGMVYGTWNVSLLIAIGYVSWQGRYSMETHDRRQWGERQWLAQTNHELEMETRLQARHVDELEKENQALEDTLHSMEKINSNASGNSPAKSKIKNGPDKKHLVAKPPTCQIELPIGKLVGAPNALLCAYMKGSSPGDVAANFETIRYMAEHIRDPEYTLDRFLDHVIEAFPELRLFYTNPDEVASSGRTAEVEYQRTIGAMFAVYWLLRLGIDGEDGFCYGVNSDFKIRRPNQKPATAVLPDYELERVTSSGSGIRMRRAGRNEQKEASRQRSASTGTLPDVEKGEASDLTRREESNPGTSAEPSLSAPKKKARVSVFFNMNDEQKRTAFRNTMNWSEFAQLVTAAGCDDGLNGVTGGGLSLARGESAMGFIPEDRERKSEAEQGGGVQGPPPAPPPPQPSEESTVRVMALLCLTAFHDIMKVEAILPTVQAEHAPYLGYSAGDVIRDHDIALSYVLVHYPELLPSFAGLPPGAQKAILFTQSKLQFNHGWFVQAEAPPGAMLSTFKRVLGSNEASSDDVAIYFLHWLTDLAGAEATPLGGAEKFVLRFPHHVLASFLWSIPYVRKLVDMQESEVVEDYLCSRWERGLGHMHIPQGPSSMAYLRLASMTQDGPSVVAAYYGLKSDDKRLLAVEMSHTGCLGQLYRCRRDENPATAGGPAILVYYGPALVQRYAFDLLNLRLALVALAEVYRAGRRLWPLDAKMQGGNVTIEIGQLKSMNMDAILNPSKGVRDLWVLVQKNATEAIVELRRAGEINQLNEEAQRPPYQRYQVLAFDERFEKYSAKERIVNLGILHDWDSSQQREMRDADDRANDAERRLRRGQMAAFANSAGK